MATYALDNNYMNTTATNTAVPVAASAPQPQSPPPPWLNDPVRVTGGNAPVMQVQTAVPQTSQPQPQSPPPPQGAVTGGNAPVQQGGVVPSFTLPALDGSSYVAQATGNPAGQQQSPYQVVTDNMNRLLSGDSPYIQNARLRGTEMAQNRGLRNSSIAAGASERAAIEGAQPILNEIQSLTRQREQLGFQGEQAALDRLQGVNNRILEAEIASRNAQLDFQFRRTLQGDAALQQDWLSSQNFTREFNAQLATLPLTNAASLSNLIAQYALENPEVYTPEVISGMQSFFTGSLIATLQQYFPNLGYGTATPTGGA